MNTVAEKFTDFVIADLSLADWGRKEIRIAETEMPGLMAIRDEFAAAQPSRARASPAPAHDHPDRRADRDADRPRRRSALGLVQHLLDPGPRRRRHRRPGIPVFAVKGETLADYWDYTHRIFEWADGVSPT
jgi:adenosylhomocysteinase